MYFNIKVAAEFQPAEELEHRHITEHHRCVALLTCVDMGFEVRSQLLAEVEPNSRFRVAVPRLADQLAQDHPATIGILHCVVSDNRPDSGVVKTGDLRVIQQADR